MLREQREDSRACSCTREQWEEEGKGPTNPHPDAETWIHCLSPGQPGAFAALLCSPGSRAAPCRSRMVQASSYPDTLRFRLPLFPSYYGNWQIYVTNEIFCLKPLIACLLLPPILLLSTINSARLGQCSPLLTGSVAGISPCCKDITHQE